MPKIGILTYFWSDNPGTFLQAYSTCLAFKKVFKDCEVELVNCATGKVHLNIGRNSIKPKQLIQDANRYLIYKNYQKNILPLSKTKLITQNTQRAICFIEEQKYDLISVGADTILKFTGNNFKEDTIPFYWLSKKIAAKKVLYAASAGTLLIDEMSEKQKNSCEVSINDFDFLGVRDHSTLELIQKLWKGNTEKIKMVPDPTFTFQIDYSYAEAYIKRKKLDTTKPVLALNTLRSFKYSACLAKHFRSLGYQVVSLMPSNVADMVLFDLSPFEWAGIFKYFDLVVTDRFHGTLFSLKNKTPVLGVVCDRIKTNSLGRAKVHSLLKEFGLEKTNYLNCFNVNTESEVIDFAERSIEPLEKKRICEMLDLQKNSYMSSLKEVMSLLL